MTPTRRLHTLASFRSDDRSIEQGVCRSLAGYRRRRRATVGTAIRCTRSDTRLAQRRGVAVAYPGCMALMIRDETPTGEATGNVVLVEVPETITLRELIRLRVREEVAKYNAHPTVRFQGLVRPTDAEEELNGYLMRTPHRIDWEQQADAALKAFGHNAFFVLVGDRQVDDLDEELALGEATDVAFVRLVPLVGG